MTGAARSSHTQDHRDAVALYALGALPSTEVAEVEALIATCGECQAELLSLRSLVDAFVAWPTDVLRPSGSLWGKLSRRIAGESGGEPLMPAAAAPPRGEWQDAAPGISYRLLSTDPETSRVTMLVRLAPGVDYPPHLHAGVEELHLLHGELVMDDKTLFPGDYLRSEPSSADRRVWSRTGCTCVLSTSVDDRLL